MKRNYKLTVSYDGSRYYGWEHQKSTPLTIQGKLEAVLTEMAGTAADVTGAGRTDAGVHAKAMTASVQLDTGLSEPLSPGRHRRDRRPHRGRTLPRPLFRRRKDLLLQLLGR